MTELSPEQEALIPIIRDKWLNRIFGGQPSDDKGIIEGVKWLYSIADLPEPVVIIQDSPLGCQIAANIIKAQVSDQAGDQVGEQVRAQVLDQVRAQVWAQVRDQVWAQVRAQVWAQIRDQVWVQVRDQVRAQVRDQVRVQARAQVWAQVWDQVRAQVWAQVRDQVRDQYFPITVCDILFNAEWCSFYDYFEQIGILRHEKLEKYLAYLQSGPAYAIFLRGFALVSRLPEKISRDGRHRLHSDNGPAVKWRDGYGQYFWRGVSVDRKLIETPDQVTRQDFISEKNAERRRAMFERLGSDRIIELLDLVEVDSDIIGRNEVSLLRSKEVDDLAGEYLQFVRVQCPSTGRVYQLSVPPTVRHAKEAVAWTFGLTSDQYHPKVET